ncbi:MAG TPA: ABC transporter permease [Stellaceae bacterium]|nr:ABC transporter permease [Stellaceae bacterium]
MTAISHTAASLDDAGEPRARIASWGTLLAAPYALYLVLVLLVPLGIVTVYSFFTYSTTGVALPVLTLRNYAQLADPYFLRLIGRTAGIALKTTAICVVLGYPLAYALARAKGALASLGFFLLLTPLMVSPVVRALGWYVLLDRNGLVNTVLVACGAGRQQLLFSEPAVLVGLSHLLLPFMVLPLVASIERIPPSLEEAARNLGASPLGVFRKVILPLSLPGLISGAVLVYVESASAYVLPALLGGRFVRMIGNEVYDALLVSYNVPQAAMLTVALVVVTIGILGASMALARRAIAVGRASR